MSAPQTAQSLGVEASRAAAGQTAAAGLELLDGDELVEFSIKPALWYIPIVSFNWVCAAGVLAALVAVSQQQRSAAAATALLLLSLAALGRVAVAALQWASRLYVLTNRRVMRFHGVLQVSAAECQLRRIRQARPRASWYQRLVQLGTIEITPAGQGRPAIVFEHVARPQEIYDKLIRAIHRSQSGPQR